MGGRARAFPLSRYASMIMDPNGSGLAVLTTVSERPPGRRARRDDPAIRQDDGPVRRDDRTRKIENRRPEVPKNGFCSAYWGERRRSGFPGMVPGRWNAEATLGKERSQSWPRRETRRVRSPPMRKQVIAGTAKHLTSGTQVPLLGGSFTPDRRSRASFRCSSICAPTWMPPGLRPRRRSPTRPPRCRPCALS